MARITDAQWLAEQFETEVCSECGWDAVQHSVGTDMLGNRRLVCDDPIPDTLSDQAAQDELNRRLGAKPGVTRRRVQGNVHQSITGTVHGFVIQAGDMGPVTFN